jgi:SnoaL-like domain
MGDGSERDRLIDEAVAREGIRDLIARYNSNGDSGRFEPLFELFAPDAVMETGDFNGKFTRYDGREEVKKIFTGARDRMQAQPDAATGYIRHFTATHQIDLVDADHATGRCYFVVLMAHGIDHWGRYVDQYVRIDGRWKFAHRKVHLDGKESVSWFTNPGPVQS